MNAKTDSWLDLLREAVGASSLTQVSITIGYSKATISLVLAGKYGGSTDKVARKVESVYMTIGCPYLKTTIKAEQCSSIAMSQAPTHHPAKMAHWKFCLKCHKRPVDLSKKNQGD